MPMPSSTRSIPSRSALPTAKQPGMRCGALGALAVSAFLSLAAAPSTSHAASVDASAGIATAYLFRGADLSNGAAAFFGDVFWNVGAADEDGFGGYVGAWLSSGDTAAGTEYDLLAGITWQRGWFSLDFGAVGYVYPDRIAGAPETTLSLTTTTITVSGVASVVITAAELESVGSTGESTDAGEFSEAYLGLSAGPVSLYYYDNVAGNTGYSYLSLGWDVGDFSLLAGQHSSNTDADDYQHADVTWNYNDYLSLTVSARFGEGDAAEASHSDTVATLALQLPINLDALQ